MSEETTNAFLGTGWAFPPQFDLEGRSVAMTSDREDIEQSLRILLSTLPGERVMQPKYGCDLTPLLFEPLTTTLITDMSDRVRNSILYFEARIVPEKISIVSDEILSGKILIQIDYQIAATNSRHNFVYPFYREEGTEIS